MRTWSKNLTDMKFQKTTPNNPVRMSKQERQQYYEFVEKEISGLAYQDQIKLEFAKQYVNDLIPPNVEDCIRLQIGPLDKKSLEYFIFAILIQYERSFWES